jgi:predicted lipoprotein with Yx(FWY)xxD motif
MRQALRIPVLGAVAGLLFSAVACGGSSYGSGGGGNNPPYTPPAAGAPTMKLATNATLGNYLVDGNGRSLYYYAKDFPAAGSNAAVSNCNGGCVAVWPIFDASSVVVQGINASDVGEITRSDGSKQSTFRGWPLYYFAGDASAGSVNGEGVDSIWFVLHDQAYSVLLMSNPSGQQPTLYLADGAGRTVYYFFQDTVGTATGAPVSACTTTCLASWPIFLTNSPVVPSILHASDFTVFTRPDGQMQSAYKGHPLYSFAGDAAPGDTKGRGVNNVWDSLDPRVL